jgi:hypothetical protein
MNRLNEEERHRELGRQTKYLLLGVVILLAFCLVVAGLSAAQLGGFKVALLGIGWALAFFFPAFVIGMLFGVPKRRSDPRSVAQQEPGGGRPDAINAALELNPNLEQISDWATKMITGVTLVSAKSIPSYCHRAGVYVGYSLAKTADMNAASVGSLIAILFSGVGFLSGYVFTSTYFTRILDMTVRTLNSAESIVAELTPNEKQDIQKMALERPKILKAVGLSSREKLGSPAELNLTPKAALLEDLPVDPSGSAESLELLGMAKFRAGRLAEAKLAFEAAIARDRSRYRCYHGLGNVLFDMGRYADAVNVLAQGRDYINKEAEDRLYPYYYYDLLVCYCLYLQPPQSYEKVLQYADEYLNRYKTDPHGSIQYYRACAFGQRALEKLRRDPAADITEESQKAREAIDKALSISPMKNDLRERVKKLLHADPESDDNDLVAFRDRPEFQSLL